MAQREGLIDSGTDPLDVLSLVTAMSLSWSPASLLVAASAAEEAAVHERRRCALAEAVRRALTAAVW